MTLSGCAAIGIIIWLFMKLAKAASNEFKGAPIADECDVCGCIYSAGRHLFIMEKEDKAVVVGVCCRKKFESSGFKATKAILI